MRVNLNYDWQFSEDFKEEYLSNRYQGKNFQVVNIPHTVKEVPYNNFDEESYQFVSCYRKMIVVSCEQLGKRVILEFKAVANACEVFINGKFAFSHKGGYTAFSGEVTELLVEGENILVVKVDSRELEEVPPFGKVVDFLTYGGIYREVYLHIEEKTYISQIHIASLDTLTSPKMEVELQFNQKAGENAYAVLFDSEKKMVAEFEIACIGQSSVKHIQKVNGIKLWDIDSPNLYILEITYGNVKKEVRLGFREAYFKKNGFYLNGKPLKIRGLNRHQSYPYVGYAMPKAAQIADADYLKIGLGLNLVRTSHYPNSEHFLNRCDEIGLLVFTEIPGWQHISDIKEWREITYQHVREMINQDYNHPSIILWGVRINESGDDKELYTKTNEIAHSLDKTRQTGGVRCIPRSEFLEDVYTYNDFNHSGKNGGLMPKLIVCGNRAPLLISEHNGHMFPTKSFDHEKKRQEHALRHAKVLNDTYKHNGVAGAIGWCMSDYNTHKDFGSGDKICYHGVSDMFRIDKLAAYVYKSQQEDYPVLEVTSNMEIGDNAGGQVGKVYMLTNCDSVNLYKSGKLINTFDIAKLAKASKYKYLPHPPVQLDDIIGNQIEQTGRFSKHGAKRLKKFLLAVKEYGTFPAIMRMPHTILGLMMRYKLGIAEITYMFGQFVTNWGDKTVSYKFEGIKNGKSVMVEKASVIEPQLEVYADSLDLLEEDTYTVSRIVIKALSQTGGVMPYSNDVVELKTQGDIEIIGESTVALIGGVRGVWIKTKGKPGVAKVMISSRLGKKTLEFNISKKD